MTSGGRKPYICAMASEKTRPSDWLKNFPRKQFTDLIATGRTETQALEIINSTRELQNLSPWNEAVVVQLQVKRTEFREQMEDAKRKRADYWFNGIAESVAKDIAKDEVPAEKLKFDQRKYMAAIDNPEKYSEKHKMDISIGLSIFQEMKDLPTREVSNLLKSADPFQKDIDAEFKVVEEDEDEIDESDEIDEEEIDIFE